MATKLNTETIKTGDDGTVKIGDLQTGYYYLYETKAPDGYIRLTEPVEIVVDSSKESVAVGPITYTQTYNGEQAQSQDGRNVEPPTSENGDCYVLRVTNTSGARLPNTGGPGTTLIYALGALMVLSALALLIAKRRED